MKALAIPIIGTMLIVVAVVMLFLYFNGTVFMERSTMEKGETALSLSHDVELVRKMIQTSVESVGQRAAYELGNEGGGYTEWNSTSPIVTDIQEMLRDRMVSLMGYGEIVLSNSRTLTLDLPIISVDTPLHPCRTPDQSICFLVTGYQPFVLKDDYLLATASANATLSEDKLPKMISTSYFRLVYVGQLLATATEADVMNGYNGKPGLNSLTDYSDEAAVTKIITDVTNELRSSFASSWSGLNFEVSSINWNDKIATTAWQIRDENSLAPIKDSETKVCSATPKGLDCLHLNFMVKVHA